VDAVTAKRCPIGTSFIHGAGHDEYQSCVHDRDRCAFFAMNVRMAGIASVLQNIVMQSLRVENFGLAHPLPVAYFAYSDYSCCFSGAHARKISSRNVSASTSITVVVTQNAEIVVVSFKGFVVHYDTRSLL
jgi:hypothetical protein